MHDKNSVCLTLSLLMALTACQLCCAIRVEGKQQPQATRMSKIGDEVVSIEAGEIFFKAQECITNKQFDQAATLFKKFLESYPNSSVGHYKLGFALLQQGKDAAALEEAKRSTELKPTFFGGWALVGEACVNLKLEDQARTAYQKALAIQPTGENADIIREHLSDMDKDRDEALATAAIAEQNKQVNAQNRVIMSLNNALALCDQANALVKQGQFEQGIQTCRNALKAAPDSAQVKENVVACLNNYAADCVQKQNLKQAEELMKEAMALQAKGGVSAQSQKTTLRNYSALLKFQGRNEEAKQLEEKMNQVL